MKWVNFLNVQDFFIKLFIRYYSISFVTLYEGAQPSVWRGTAISLCKDFKRKLYSVYSESCWRPADLPFPWWSRLPGYSLYLQLAVVVPLAVAAPVLKRVELWSSGALLQTQTLIFLFPLLGVGCRGLLGSHNFTWRSTPPFMNPSLAHSMPLMNPRFLGTFSPSTKSFFENDYSAHVRKL